jgi:dipeptidyl-peptidase-4
MADAGRIGDVQWIHDGAGLWYERKVEGRTELVVVDAATGAVETFIDTERTRAELRARSGGGDKADRGPGVPSPDGSMSAFLRDDNVWVRWNGGGREVQLTSDGDELVAYDVTDGWSGTWAHWSPDARHLVLMRTDRTSVPTRPSVDWLAAHPTVEWVVDYPWSTQASQSLFTWDAGTERLRPLDVNLAGVDAHWTAFFGWTPDGTELLVGKQYPGEKRVEVVGVDPASGAVRAIFAEAGDVPMEADALDLTVLDDGFLWASERDGLRRLYRYDAEGQVLGPITPDTVRAGWVEGVDTAEGWVYFMAHANPSRPYDEHFCRVRLDGTGGPTSHPTAV